MLSVSPHFDAAAISQALERAGIKRAYKPEDEQAAQILRDQAKADGCDAALALPVSRLVAEARLVPGAAKVLVKLLIDHQSSAPRDFTDTDPARTAIVEGHLSQAIRRENPLFGMLNPRSGRVPPELSLPVVSQIKPM